MRTAQSDNDNDNADDLTKDFMITKQATVNSKRQNLRTDSALKSHRSLLAYDPVF